MKELMNFHDVDIQWGNHDISWMGAAAGNLACICNVLRIAISYNSFDVLEDGYGINLRPLSMFAAKVYQDDPCVQFMPKILDENIYDAVDPVSYTHLDVYKRQVPTCPIMSWPKWRRLKP